MTPAGRRPPNERTPSPGRVVRSLIACEDIRPDPDNPKKLSLLRVVNTIRPKGGSGYPLVQPAFAVYGVLTDGRGSGELWVSIRHAESGERVAESPHQQVTFPADPLVLNGLSFKFRNLVFPTPGLYWVQLWFDGETLAELPIVLR